jgi:hypothetical protein
LPWQVRGQRIEDPQLMRVRQTTLSRDAWTGWGLAIGVSAGRYPAAPASSTALYESRPSAQSMYDGHPRAS